MTREEAIKWFRESPFYHKNHVPFNMAIKALEQEPATKNDLSSGLDKNSKKLEKDCDLDCISRTSALDSINWAYNLSDAYQKINELPSVTPQKSEWEHDHEMLRAYSDGSNEVLGKIRAEIENLPIAFMRAGEIQKGALKIIDKYKAGSEMEE